MTTTGKAFTPIYTSRDLAALLTEHDREHPDHGKACSCRHGLIAAARPLLSTKGQLVRRVREPRPYVPPDVLRGTTRGTEKR